MMTDRQRIAFFKLVNAAFAASGFGIDREAWRKREMAVAIGVDSVKSVRGQEVYEDLMLHFAKLAQDAVATSYYATAIERRHRFVLEAIEADLGFLRGRGCGDAYMEGIYHQSGGPSYNKIGDIPADHLRLVIQIADTHVRKLRREACLDPGELPSAGAPWFIRGRKASRGAARRADERHPALA